MSLSAAMLPEIELELEKTRQTLARIPNNRLDWQPHDKSGSFGWLAGHLANLPHWGLISLTTPELNLAVTPPAPNALSTEEAVEMFESNRDKFLDAFRAASDQTLLEPWRLTYHDKELFNMPRVAVIRTMVINHLIHHRGQLSVYLRLNDIPLPALYGPSADEGQIQP
jgi:uncharacterized damage-inducible protein DinB